MSQFHWTCYEFLVRFPKDHSFTQAPIIPHIFSLELVHPVDRNIAFYLRYFSLAVVSEITIRMKGGSRPRIADTKAIR